MKKISIVFLASALLFLLVGCKSSVNLSREYQIVSDKIDGLQDELKSIVKVQVSLEAYIKAKNQYLQEKKELHEVRNSNEEKDLVIGPEPPEDLPLTEELQAWQKNYSQVSDQVRDLEKQRNEIVKKQVALEQ